MFRFRFIIKVQIYPVEPGGGGYPQKVYDQRRSFAISILPSNCPGYGRLDEIIRGSSHGKKGYFESYLEDSKCYILAHNMLPLQTW